LLALFTIGAQPVPPLQMNAVCFAIGGGIGLIWTGLGAGFGVLRRVPLRVYAFGTFGLFVANLLYFGAIYLAPMAETGLIGYLWPLFIVLLSGLLPGEHLGRLHIAGAVLALAGAALMVLRGGVSLPVTALPGFALAFAFAISWACYSVGSRRFGRQPTEAVTVYFFAGAVLSLIAHLAFESTAWPSTAMGWASLIALGAGPIGASYFAWDVGMKHGDIQLLGVASYAAPLLSTLALIAAGIAPLSPILGVAACLIAGGAALAASATRRSAARSLP
jgi:drug/metabolite transporter (DMT)-like permease